MVKKATKSIKQDYDDKLYEVYMQERAILNDISREGNRSFDNAILTLSTGAFGLSITFIKQITPSINQNTLWILVSSWSCFAISLCLTLVSFFTSKCACQRQIEIMEIKYFPDQCINKKTNTDNVWNGITKKINVLSLIFFVTGIILLTTFSSLNLK